MKRDDVIAGVIGGTIFVVGCTFGIFGYHKMNAPLFAQAKVEESVQTYSYGTSKDSSDLVRNEQDISVYEPETDDSNKSDSTEEIDTLRSIVEENDYTYQESNELINEPIEVPDSRLDSDAIDRLSDNTRFSVDTSDYSDYNFNKYNNEEQQRTSETYVLNTSTLKIHHPNCNDVKKISPENYATSSESIDELMAQGYTRCKHCFK